MFQNQAETIFIQLNSKMFDEMVEEAAKWPGKETGGMMFGKIKEIESGLEIRIEKTIIPLEEECVRNSAYFEINPEYARQILDNENLLYLGNWHKHLGYGGPSHGDHRQITEYFSRNPHKNIVLAVIVDSFTENNHKLIVEVYRRNESIGEEEKSRFQSFRIAESNISYFSDDKNLSEDKAEFTKERISIVKQELVLVYDSISTIEDIQEFTGSTADEKIVSFPFKFDIETEGSKKTLDLLVLISFPPNFPDGQVYIDISSQDLSRKITIEKHPANVLYEKDLIQPFLLLLKTTLEEEIPEILKQSLWKVMSRLK